MVIKPEADGTKRYKARLVSRGFKDEHLYKFSEIYAPVVGISDVRVLFAIANKLKWEIIQMDVDTAFLNSELDSDKPVYMEIPEGVDVDKRYREKKVCKLVKALYGLKVSPKRWYLKFRESMVKMGFTVFDGQSCMFYWRRKGTFTIVMLYVDDILITGNNRDKIIETKNKLCEVYKMKVLGSPKKFLGIQIERDLKNSVFTMCQTKMIENIVRKFGLENRKFAATPMMTEQNAKKRVVKPTVQTELDLSKGIPYREAVGALLYVTNCTRPDIAYAVNVLTRRVSDFQEKDWIKVEQVIMYLAYTKDLKLTYLGNGNELIGYSDASMKLMSKDGKSVSGCVITVFNDAVSWGTRRQDSVAVSSSEAEYIALNSMIKDVVYYKELCELITSERIQPVVYEDNKATIKNVQRGQSKSLRHLVGLKSKYVCDEYSKGTFDLIWVRSEDQLADPFTKAKARPAFERVRKLIMHDEPRVQLKDD